MAEAVPWARLVDRRLWHHEVQHSLLRPPVKRFVGHRRSLAAACTEGVGGRSGTCHPGPTYQRATKGAQSPPDFAVHTTPQSILRH